MQKRLFLSTVTLAIASLASGAALADPKQTIPAAMHSSMRLVAIEPPWQRPARSRST